MRKPSLDSSFFALTERAQGVRRLMRQEVHQSNGNLTPSPLRGSGSLSYLESRLKILDKTVSQFNESELSSALFHLSCFQTCAEVGTFPRVFSGRGVYVRNANVLKCCSGTFSRQAPESERAHLRIQQENLQRILVGPLYQGATPRLNVPGMFLLL